MLEAILVVAMIEPRSSHHRHLPEGGATEITLCAEVAGLTNISQSIPPWINEKIAGMLRVKLGSYESSHPGR
jgi:hypothetical protein